MCSVLVAMVHPVRVLCLPFLRERHALVRDPRRSFAARLAPSRPCALRSIPDRVCRVRDSPRYGELFLPVGLLWRVRVWRRPNRLPTGSYVREARNATSWKTLRRNGRTRANLRKPQMPSASGCGSILDRPERRILGPSRICDLRILAIGEHARRRSPPHRLRSEPRENEAGTPPARG